jgi:hypothetical protein
LFGGPSTLSGFINSKRPSSEYCNFINLDSQRELGKEIHEYYLLMLFLTFYGKKDKGQDFVSIGAEAGERYSLFFERDLWQRLLLYLNEKENLP